MQLLFGIVSIGVKIEKSDRILYRFYELSVLFDKIKQDLFED